MTRMLASFQGHPVANLDTSVTTEPSVTGIAQSEAQAELHASTGDRKGRAPPVDPFSVEDEAVTLDDWLLALQRAATWNV